MASDALIDSLIKDVSEGLGVFRRLGFDLSDAQILERARNIVTGVVNNYFVAMLDSNEEGDMAGLTIEAANAGRRNGVPWPKLREPS